MSSRFNQFKNQIVTQISSNKHLKFGVPFVGLLLMGSFVISQLAKTRYEFKKGKRLTQAELEAFEGRSKSNVKVVPQEEKTLEVLHENYMKKEFVEDYENVRGPRPWEKESEWEANRRSNKRIPRAVKTKDSYNI